MTVERDWFWFWFWFYYALWLASVFTLVLVLRQSSENRSNSHSSTMKVDLESQAGRVVSSLLIDTLPYYFAVSGYKNYPVPSSHLFKEFKGEQEKRVLRFPAPEPTTA